VVAVASAVIFALVALMAHLLVGMHDRAAPVVLDAPPRLMLDFSSARSQGDAALAELKLIDVDAGLGLVKQGANLTGDLRGVVLIPLNDSTLTGQVVQRYEDAAAKVVGTDAWTYTTVSGAYYVTGDRSAIPDAVERLVGQGVLVERSDTSLRDGVDSLVRVRGMLLAFVTACVLLVTLVLYWLAVKSRRRALSVLAGTPVSRIQVHDLGQLMILVVGMWLPVAVVASVAVGVWRGWAFVPVFAQYLLVLALLMLMVTLAAALVMSAASIPSPSLIARRAPATLGVRRAASAIKVVVFVLVLLMIGPAWTALGQAATQAEQLKRWEELADYAAVVFPDASEGDIQRIMKPFGQLVRDAERDQQLLFSETFLPAEGVPEIEGAMEFEDFLDHRWVGISLVNSGWLEVAVGADADNLVDVPSSELPRDFLGELRSWFDPVWGLPDASAEQTVGGLRFLSPSRGTVPVVGVGGELDYRDDVLLVVVPDLAGTFNDDTLLNASTGRGLLFRGIDQTQRRVEAAGLAKDVKVQYAAEQGMLAAQVATYEAWLGTASIIGLGLALGIAAMISAYVEMLLQAKNDFVRRLSGQPWLRVLSGRVVPEAAFGGGLAIVMLLLQPPGQLLAVAVTALVVLAASPLAHVLAGRRGFADVVARKL
jgi:hypothetical protein